MEVGYRISFRGFRCWPGVVPLLAGMRCSGLYGNFFVAMRAWLGMAANVAIEVIGPIMPRMAHPTSFATSFSALTAAYYKWLGVRIKHFLYLVLEGTAVPIPPILPVKLESRQSRVIEHLSVHACPNSRI